MVGTDIVRIGLVARNILQPILDAPDGSTLRLDRYVRVGLGVRLVDGLLVSTDLDLTHSTSDTIVGPKRNLAVGAEHWFVQWLGLRGGAQVNLAADNLQVVGAFGFSLPLMTGMYLDGQINHGRNSMENSWGVAAPRRFLRALVVFQTSVCVHVEHSTDRRVSVELGTHQRR